MPGVVAPGAGIALAALLLLPPARWPAPLVASAVTIGAVGARHHAGSGLTIGRALATVGAAVATALLLRWYAAGTFRLTRLRELCTLVIAAALGGALGAAVHTIALAFERDPTAAELWHSAWSTALALALGMTLIGTVVLTTTCGVAPGPAARREPRGVRTCRGGGPRVRLRARAVGRPVGVLVGPHPRVGRAPLRAARGGMVGAGARRGGRVGRRPRHRSVHRDRRDA